MLKKGAWNLTRDDFSMEEISRWITGITGGWAPEAAFEELPGATSSVLYRVKPEGQSGERPLVLRLFTNREWLEEEPELPLHEVSALDAARKIAVTAPRPVAVDRSGTACGIPAVLMTEVPGAVNLQPDHLSHWLKKMAWTLSSIHEGEVGEFPWEYGPWYELTNLKPLEWSRHQKRWDRVLTLLAEGRPGRTAFIHRDFHPANILWEEDRVSGVVDWVNACRGPAEADVAHCRINLALLMGLEAAESFSQAYEQFSGHKYDPWWDLNAFAEFFPDRPVVYPGWPAFGVHHLTDRVMVERADLFLEAALAHMKE